MVDNLEVAGLPEKGSEKSGIKFEAAKNIEQPRSLDDTILDFSPRRSAGLEAANSISVGSKHIPSLSLEYGLKPLEIPSGSSIYDVFSGRGILKRARENMMTKGGRKAPEFEEFDISAGDREKNKFEIQNRSPEKSSQRSSEYWREHWKGYWKDYWRDYHSANRGSERPQTRSVEPGNRSSRSRSELLPAGWSYKDYAGAPSESETDKYLPPEWRGNSWRRSGETDYRRDTTRPTSDRNARIVPYKYGDTRIVSEPTITVQKIEEVLARYKSPAQGMGQLIFDLGVKHNINPALALAFFVKESSAGTRGWAVRTRNWGNRKGRGPAGRAGPFMKYHSFEESLKDWFPYIHRRYVNRGLDTLPKLISVYAPNYDGNNEAGYVRSVMNMMRKWSV